MCAAILLAEVQQIFVGKSYATSSSAAVFVAET
jgi:hypothetical protein